MNKRYDLTIQLVANAIPLIGFWFFNWSMFAIIYLYWAEGFITAFYGSIKIVMASGPEINGQKSSKISNRIVSSIKHFAFRTFVLLFYLLFIFFFVAFPAGQTHTDQTTQNFTILIFRDNIFNNALLAYFLGQLILFISTFILTDDYRNKPSSDYKVLFDSRTIVLHLVIVLGTFSYQFLQQYERVNNKLPALSYVLILVFLKSLADIVLYKTSGNKASRHLRDQFPN